MQQERYWIWWEGLCHTGRKMSPVFRRSICNTPLWATHLEFPNERASSSTSNRKINYSAQECRWNVRQPQIEKRSLHQHKHFLHLFYKLSAVSSYLNTVFLVVYSKRLDIPQGPFHICHSKVLQQFLFQRSERKYSRLLSVYSGCYVKNTIGWGDF